MSLIRTGSSGPGKGYPSHTWPNLSRHGLRPNLGRRISSPSSVEGRSWKGPLYGGRDPTFFWGGCVWDDSRKRDARTTPNSRVVRCRTTWEHCRSTSFGTLFEVEHLLIVSVSFHEQIPVCPFTVPTVDSVRYWGFESWRVWLKDLVRITRGYRVCRTACVVTHVSRHGACVLIVQ